MLLRANLADCAFGSLREVQGPGPYACALRFLLNDGARGACCCW